MSNRLVSDKLDQSEASVELSLRPLTLNEYVGQTALKHNLNILITAAKARNEVLDHTLLF